MPDERHGPARHGEVGEVTLLVAWTRAVLWPQAEQRMTLAMAPTANTRDSGRSSNASTRTARRWSRIVIASRAATRAPW